MTTSPRGARVQLTLDDGASEALLGSQQEINYPADFGERRIARMAKPGHG